MNHTSIAAVVMVKGVAGMEVGVGKSCLCVYPHTANGLHFCFHWMGR